MKIPAVHQAPVSLANGDQLVAQFCRPYSSMESSAVESLESQKEKQKLWWTGSGLDFSTDSFPPDDHFIPSFTSNAAILVNERQNYAKTPPLWNPLPAEEQSIDHRHADLSSSDEEPHSQSSILISDCHSERHTSESVAMARIKLMCSFGGRIIARPVDRKLRYVGGETHIVSVSKRVSFTQFMSKMAQFYGAPSGLKYQLPDEELDALVSVSSDDDLQNMMEEYDKVGFSGGTATKWLRLFFFSTPDEVEVADGKFEGKDGCSISDPRYVDALNGVSRKLHAHLLEDNSTVFLHVNATNTAEGGGRMPSLEQDNEMTQCSASSSSPSSPLSSRHTHYRKPPGLLDISIQNLSENLRKVPMAPLVVEVDVDREALGSSPDTPCRYHYEHPPYDSQFSQAADSPRITHPDGFSSWHGENWHGLRHVDSQSKLAHRPNYHSEYRTNLGGPLKDWHDVSYLRDTASPQGDHLRLSQQHIFPLPSLQQSHHHHHQYQTQHQPHHQYQNQHQHQHHQQYHHQQPQQYQQQHHHHQQHQLQQVHKHLHNEGDVRPSVHSHHEVHTQSQIVHQLPYHHVHPHVSVHNGCLWSAEQHGMPRPIQASTQIYGLAPTPPYHMGSRPPSPRVGVFDYHGKCACGLQHSQVHRGITVSIGEQSSNRWPLFQGDQGAQRQPLRSSSRFYNNSSFGAAWQQATDSGIAAETEHKELVNHWPQNYGRYSKNAECTDSQARNQNLHCSEPLGNNGENTAIHDQIEISKRCMCINCVDRRRQQMEMARGHCIYSEASVQTSDWFSLRKGFDLESGVSAGRQAFPRLSMFKDGEQNNDDTRISEVGSGVSQLPGDPDQGRAATTQTDSARKSQPSSGAMIGKFAVVKDLSLVPSLSAAVEGGENIDRIGLFSELENPYGGAVTSLSFCGHNFPGRVEGDAPKSAKSGHESSDQGSNGVAFFAGHRHAHLVGPDVISLGSKSPTSAGSHPALKVSNAEQTEVSPIFGQSPFSSTNMTKFTFAVGEPMMPLPERIGDKDSVEESFTLGMSVTEVLADSSMASSVLDFSSDGVLTWIMSGTEQDTVYLDSQTVPKEEKDNAHKAKVDTRMVTFEENLGKILVAEDDIGSPSVTRENTPNGSAVVGKSSAGYGCPKVIAKEEFGAISPILNGGSNETSCQEKVSEVDALGTPSERNEPSLSEAEAEAIARGLQTIKNSDLEDMKELGSGTYGTVYHGKWRGSDVAIKRIKASCFTGPPSERERLMADFWREACTLGQLHHPNVVAFYGVVPDGLGGTLATVTEYMVNGSLKQVLRKKDRTIDRKKRLFIAMDAAFGMEYLHSKNIVHFDLKCENLLVNMRDVHRPICKVGDFGLSKVKHHTLVSGGVRGTLPWMAPELLSSNCSMVSEKVDVFSFGIVMWELVTGEEPYANMHHGAIIGGIANNTLRPSIPSWCDPGWRSLMERCWSGNPAERPAFAEIASELRAIAATMNLK